MKNQSKLKVELQGKIKELQLGFLNSIKDIDESKRKQIERELIIALKGISLENEEKARRAAEIIIANLEVKFLNEEKAKCAAELVIANIELVFQNNEKSKRALELNIANKELLYQNDEKAKRANALILANIELAYQNKEKSEREAELNIANKELQFENQEKENRAAELIVINKELILQYEEKAKLAAELVIANKSLFFQNQEKSKREAELSIANEELQYENQEKENRASELIIINKELILQYEEKAELAAELAIANKELFFQNQEKEKQTFELIQAKKNAEESDRLKSAFLANMSHEIRTPMNGILGFSDLLREPQLTGEMQQDYIGIIKKSGLRMLNIINNIVSISKIESGLMEANLHELNINNKIEYIHDFFKPEIEQKGLSFSIYKALPENEAIIRSDGEKIYSILTNLVKNAIKHTDSGHIELGYILKNQNQTSELEFYIKDTGTGILKERQNAIFERFIQADISDKMAFQGAGLGLSISKAYVELLGGKIWLESVKGQGSTFYFTLPYISSKTEISNKINKKFKTPTIDLKLEPLKLKILIVEDDEVSRLLITTMVKNEIGLLFEARTGQEAIDILRKNPEIDLILMDIQMPVMNGFEATRQIREFNKDVVIIAQTASGLREDKKRLIGVGCNEYISKPIKKSKLLTLIHNQLGTKI